MSTFSQNVFIFIAFLCGYQPAYSEEFRDTLLVGRDTIVVFINSIPFQAKAHRIDSSKTEFGTATNRDNDTIYWIGRIDGRIIYGTDGELPRTEISKFIVSWNGHPVKIPKSLYSDCFEPHLSNISYETPIIRTVESENGSSVLIHMQGSDAGGSYEVWWIISRDGKHSRFITKVC
jgi:hypothetical protein